MLFLRNIPAGRFRIPVSFASDKNTDIGLVQFAMKKISELFNTRKQTSGEEKGFEIFYCKIISKKAEMLFLQHTQEQISDILCHVIKRTQTFIIETSHLKEKRS